MNYHDYTEDQQPDVIRLPTNDGISEAQLSEIIQVSDPKKSSKFLKSAIVLSVIIFLALGGLATYYFNYQFPTGSNLTITLPEKEVVIYQSYDQTARTITVWKKQLNSEPIKLDEMPWTPMSAYIVSYAFSADNKYLYLNTYDKIRRIDLTTNLATDFYVPSGYRMSSIALNQAGTSLMIVDETYNNSVSSYQYTIRELNLQNQQVTITKQGNGYIDSSISAWRKDNILIMDSARVGGPTGLASFNYDLGTNTELRIKKGSVSQSGFLAEDDKTLVRDCYTITDMMSRGGTQFPSVIDIVDPVTGNAVSSIGESGKVTHIVAFSADDTQVLYSEFKARPVTDLTGSDEDKIDMVVNKCNHSLPEITYFVKNLKSGSANKVSDYRSYLASWKVGFDSGIYSENTADHKSNNLIFNNYVIAKGSGDLYLSVMREYIISN